MTFVTEFAPLRTRHSRAAHGPDERGDAAGERRQVVSPLQSRNGPARGMAVRDRADALCHPRVIRFDAVKHHHGVVAVRIENGQK